MRAARVHRPAGPDAVVVEEIDEPGREGPWGEQLLVDVHAAGVAFPDLLLSKGEYQLKPEPPFVLGTDFAGVVRHAPEGSRYEVGQRVCGVLPHGTAAETIVAAEDTTVLLPDSLGFVKGAALPMNYLTAQFALADRGGLCAGETVLVHGAAGGVGTATLQVAKGYGARTIAVVSTPEKADFARAAGADEVVLADGFLARVKELTDGNGVDLVLDVVGGALFTDSLRALAPQGRLLVVGFAGGEIPQVRVNRLLLNNTDVRGVGWGAYVMVRPGYLHRQWEQLLPMIESGIVDPPVGSTYPLEGIGEALAEMAERRTLGKTVLTLRPR